MVSNYEVLPDRAAVLKKVRSQTFDPRELLVEIRQHGGIVVDPLDERALIGADDAATDESLDRFDRRLRQLARVVEVGDQIDPPVSRGILPKRLL